MMQVIFWTIAAFGLIHFLVARRRTDFFTLGFVAACIYFLPGFFGYVLYPEANGFLPVKIAPEVYLVMAVVLVVIVITCVLWDRFGPQHGPALVLLGAELAPIVALTIGIIGLAGTLVTVGDKLFMVDKLEMLQYINRWYITYVAATTVGAVLAYEARSNVLLGVALLLLVFDLFVGFRASIAMTLIALFMLAISKRARTRPISYWKGGLLWGCLFAGVVLYKGLLVDVKAGEWGMVAQHLTEPEWYLLQVGYSEPFITQAILNEVLRDHFVVGLSHLWSLCYQAILFAPELGAHPVSFNDLFQPVLFPGSDYMGMANNLWAEAISTGGWGAVIVFAAGFSSMLGLGSYLLMARDGAIRSGAALAFTWLAVYAHRNDLLNQLAFEKRTLLIWTVCIVGSAFVVLHHRPHHSISNRPKRPGLPLATS